MKEQEDLFNNWKNCCDRLKSLSAFIQNDFEVMIKEGIATKEDIKQSVIDFRIQYEDIMGSINLYETKIHNLLKSYSE